MLIELLILTAIIVFIIDLSGVIEEMESGLAKWLKVKKARIPKPFSCSLCMTWWTGLIYLICVNSFTLGGVAYVAMLSYLTPVIYNALTFVFDIPNKVISVISRALGL